MRGTGSADIEVNDLFVPSHRVVEVGQLMNPAPGFEGPLYRVWPWQAILGETIVSIGIAAAAIDDLLELVETKVPAYNATPLREQALAQHDAGKALGRVNAARDTVHAAATAAMDDVADGSLLSTDAKIRLQAAVCFGAEASAEAVRLVQDTAGTSAIRLWSQFRAVLPGCTRARAARLEVQRPLRLGRQAYVRS